ncbi:YeeE/YedE family protein [Sneathiella sp. P13V-1]|uniref:YeeE/YedE family protein n=1 Tax=Sneathiella sp. P13V-1 TaxID=2697366 RepID=UPI00187B356D|nr:YeeE/YedE thiosulfate transporter family protein [Sneathiella sp. P13V-1]MBE7636847.1 YeeE/YedE family protein [Sneathiella sp. P13V-1]
MENFTPFLSLAGGLIIGIAATLLLAGGRIAGISGILGGLIPPAPASDRKWRWLFLLGLIGGAVLFPVLGGDISYININPYNLSEELHYAALVAGGLLVGLGTTIGSGCTSGHGICGLGRLSIRSLASVMTFMLVAGIVVFVIRTVTGG